MTQIVAQCPSCHARFKIRDRKLLGRKLECGKCKTTFRVQGAVGNTRKPRAANKVKEAVVEDPWLDVDVNQAEDEFAFEESDYEAAAPALPRRPAKKKKKSKRRASRDGAESQAKNAHEEEPANKLLLAAMIGGGGLLGVLLLVGIFFLGRGLITGGLGGTLEAPTEFDTYVPAVRSFSCEYPSGWEASGAGGAGGKPAWARFESGGLEISIRDSHSGQAMGDIARAFGNMGGDAGVEVEPPVASIHEDKRTSAESNMNDYEEGPAEPIQTGFGEARISEFDAATTFGSKLKGYRATLLSTNHQLNVICKCPAAHFETLKPAFRKVVESIRPGGGGRRGVGP